MALVPLALLGTTCPAGTRPFGVDCASLALEEASNQLQMKRDECPVRPIHEGGNGAGDPGEYYYHGRISHRQMGFPNSLELDFLPREPGVTQSRRSDEVTRETVLDHVGKHHQHKLQLLPGLRFHKFRRPRKYDCPAAEVDRSGQIRLFHLCANGAVLYAIRCDCTAPLQSMVQCGTCRNCNVSLLRRCFAKQQGY